LVHPFAVVPLKPSCTAAHLHRVCRHESTRHTAKQCLNSEGGFCGNGRSAVVQHLSSGGQKAVPGGERLKQERDDYLTTGLALLG
jgi:hypothetical protein